MSHSTRVLKHRYLVLYYKIIYFHIISKVYKLFFVKNNDILFKDISNDS